MEQRLVELERPLDDDAVADIRGRVASVHHRPDHRRGDHGLGDLVAPPDDEAGAQGRSSTSWSTRCPTTGPRSGSPSAARPTWPASATASRSPCGRSSRRSRSTSYLLKLLGEARTGGAVTVRIGHEGPYQEFATTSVVSTGYGPGELAVGNLGVVGPTRMDYPGDDGGGPCGRPLRLPHPRRGIGQ